MKLLVLLHGIRCVCLRMPRSDRLPLGVSLCPDRETLCVPLSGRGRTLSAVRRSALSFGRVLLQASVVQVEVCTADKGKAGCARDFEFTCLASICLNPLVSAVPNLAMAC